MDLSEGRTALWITGGLPVLHQHNANAMREHSEGAAEKWAKTTSTSRALISVIQQLIKRK